MSPSMETPHTGESSELDREQGKVLVPPPRGTIVLAVKKNRRDRGGELVIQTTQLFIV
jgi:hypothetical protein